MPTTKPLGLSVFSYWYFHFWKRNKRFLLLTVGIRHLSFISYLKTIKLFLKIYYWTTKKCGFLTIGFLFFIGNINLSFGYPPLNKYPRPGTVSGKPAKPGCSQRWGVDILPALAGKGGARRVGLSCRELRTGASLALWVRPWLWADTEVDILSGHPLKTANRCKSWGQFEPQGVRRKTCHCLCIILGLSTILYSFQKNDGIA